MNRLDTASEQPTNSLNPVCPDSGSRWCQKFGYDPWGSRLITARSNLTAALTEPSAFDPATNRITGTNFGYDDAGNLTKTPGIGNAKTYL